MLNNLNTRTAMNAENSYIFYYFFCMTVALRLNYSYLKGRKQCVKINYANSDYNEIISGVPQGSIIGRVLFNLSINDLFFQIASMHNFADDNTLSAWGETASKLISTLELESKIASRLEKNFFQHSLDYL